MISVKNILTISAYEAKVLWRNWFFRIVALAGIFFITLFYLIEFSTLDDPQWHVISNSAILPYATMVFISIPQVAAVIFLATGLIKKDKKLDTNEVFFVRPISNLDYVLGKALAVFNLFFLLNIVLLCIPLIVGLTNPLITIDFAAFFIYPVLTSVPAIIFTTGISFLLVTVIRNQPITIVLLVGVTGVQLIYYFDQFSNILDFMAFRLSLLSSEITGFVDIEFALWQRAFYLLTGIAFLFITAFLLDRLSGYRLAHRATVVVGLLLLIVSSFILTRLLAMRQGPIALREEMIDINGRWSTVPNVDITAHAISLQWVGNNIRSISELLVKNNSDSRLDSIYFTLNPGLKIDSVMVGGELRNFKRDLQIVSIAQGVDLAPGEELKLQIVYYGSIVESAAYLEVDQKRYEDVNEFIIFSLKKKYAFLQEDYLLLTKDVFWYPDTQVGFNRKSAARGRQTFTNFELSVKAPEGKTAISQGTVTVANNVYHFKPEYALPQISLVIGAYEKKQITVDGIEYAVFHNPEHQFFSSHLNQLSDTLGLLITDLVHEYEDAQRIAYPFKRMQFVEVPHHFTAYDKIYESHQSFLQPESVFWPEEGGKIKQFDFIQQLMAMNKQAAQTNQVLTEKQKQANIFNDLIKKVFTKQIGYTWTWDGNNIDKPEYALFPNYYDFNSGIVSKEWPLLNRSIARYLRDNKQTQHDYSRNINGISFTEECNNLMRTSTLSEIVTQADFNKLSKSVSLKGEYLFSYISHVVGENNFKSFLYDWVNTHQHQLNTYENFRSSLIATFDIDIDPVIRSVYAETSQPAFEILDIKKYEVMDGDRKRYQVLLTARNSGETDGVMEVKFDTKEKVDDDYYYAKVNEEVVEEAPGRLSVIKVGETKLLGYVLDEKPNDLTINTIISKNIPSVISFPTGTLAKGDKGLLFDGERVVKIGAEDKDYELIVDNEDPGFSTFSPIKPTMLKAWLDSQNKQTHKYHGDWSSAYARWLATTGSDFYGAVIRSAYFTRTGNGDKVATWTPELKEDGFYDIYVYMKGKNQNEFQGKQNEGKQFTYHYIINNADGTDNIKFNISNAEPGWNYLGSYYFTKTGGSVSLTDECDQYRVYADAVKWVKQ